MQVSLICKDKIYKYNLPDVVTDNYWIGELLSIRAENGQWVLESNSKLKLIDPRYVKINEDSITVPQIDGSIIERVTLKEDNIYAVSINNSRELNLLCCSSIYEKNYKHFDIVNTQSVTIGSLDDNIITYKNPFVSAHHAKLSFYMGRWYIENFDSKFGVFINNIQIYNHKTLLSNGDVINILGLKIIMMNNSIFINNPNANVQLAHSFFANSSVKKIDIADLNEQEDTEEYVEVNKDYYTIAPRISKLIENEVVKIDEPPKLDNSKERPILLVLGSSLAFGVMMIISLVSTVQGFQKDGTSTGNTLLSLFATIAMLFGMIIMPFIDVKYDKRLKKKYEQKRQKKYKEYLNKKEVTIRAIKENQKRALFQNYLSAQECSKMILSGSRRLWERRLEDEDFLSVRLGIGTVSPKLVVNYPEEQFELEDDDLLDNLHLITYRAGILEDAPVTINLTQKNISAIISKNRYELYGMIRNIIIQMVSFHNYEDLKIACFADRKNLNEWSFIKMLPHIWNNERQFRFYADEREERNKVAQYLYEELRDRIDNQDEVVDYKTHTPYYVIIIDNYKDIENIDIISQLLKLNKNIGISFICLSDNIYDLPNQCKLFVTMENGQATIFDNEKTVDDKKVVKLDNFDNLQLDRISQKLANMPIRIKSMGTFSLPQNYSFLEMYNVGKIENLNILDRWKNNDSTLSLKVPIGIDNTGMLINLDIHEKAHGPHGLIAGSTGSGKSELIITYILSMAINYHPDDVNFLLIDYKGGGLAGAFQKNGIVLPHLVGTITNIDKNGLQRSLTSIQSELRRRQIIFNEARNITDEGTIDIYKYQRLYHDGIVKEPVAHLLIICDEFAELKQQQPDFMDELISVSRIGRSLGVHLILATQKPSGIVNDQIRSNSRFAICLKVQDNYDSVDVIKKPDAAFLKNPGQFYLQIGNDEYYVLGQSGWAGAAYIPSDNIKKKQDTAVEFISDIGSTIKRVEDVVKQLNRDEGEQLTNILKNIYQIGKEEKIKTKNLWLDNIPENIYVDELRKKYKVEKNKDTIEAVLGEYDDPNNQKQGLVKYDLMKRDNLIVFGNAKSGKETFVSTLIYDVMTNYTPEQVQFYILDFGSEALKIFQSSPHVGDVLFVNDQEKMKIFLKMLQKELVERKNILSDYNGDYNLFISKGNTMPIITVVLNNYEAFSEDYGYEYEDQFFTLTREGSKYGIIFVLTTTSGGGMRYRLGQNFSKKVVLQLNGDDDYILVMDNIRNQRPAPIFGRGLLTLSEDDDTIYEFQTAKPCNHKEYNSFIEETIEKLNNEYNVKARKVPMVPSVLELKDVKEYIKDVSSVPIGMIKSNLEIFKYDFTEKYVTIVSGKKIGDTIDFVNNIIEEFNIIKNTKTVTLNTLEIDPNKESELKKAFKEFISEIKNASKKTNDKFTLFTIIGIDRLDDLKYEFNFDEIVESANKNKMCSFIIVDETMQLSRCQGDDWFVNYVGDNTGIWVGRGVNEQILMERNDDGEEMANECDSTFGFVIENCESTFLKLVGMKNKNEFI